MTRLTALAAVALLIAAGKVGSSGPEVIPLVGRIVAVADVFDALTTSRPYKKAWAFDAGLANLREEAGRLYDAECVEALLGIQDAAREVAEFISH